MQGADRLDRRPDGVDDATVEAMGKLGEALETIEEARGHLYAVHRLTGSADLALGEAVTSLSDAGHTELARQLHDELVGRNVLAGRWTYQVVEEFDDGYYATFKRLEGAARAALVGGHRHVYEAEMKARRRTPGRSGHEATPQPPGAVSPSSSQG